MKNCTPTVPDRIRRAAASAIARTGRSPMPGPNGTDEKGKARQAPRHEHRAEREHTPRHATIDPRLAGVGLGVVAVTATLAAIPAVAFVPSASTITQAALRQPPTPVTAPRPAASEPAVTATPAPPPSKKTRAGSVADRGRRPAASPKPPRKRAPSWVNPMPSGDITSCFGHRWGALHAGVDLAAPSGTPIRAAGGGRVVSAGWSYGGYGISVLIKHGNGYLTHYGHLSRATVDSGDWVSAGKVIGREGSTGDSTGPHLHFEVHKGLWQQVNPAPWLRSRNVRIGC